MKTFKQYLKESQDEPIDYDLISTYNYRILGNDDMVTSKDLLRIDKFLKDNYQDKAFIASLKTFGPKMYYILYKKDLDDGINLSTNYNQKYEFENPLLKAVNQDLDKTSKVRWNLSIGGPAEGLVRRNPQDDEHLYKWDPLEHGYGLDKPSQEMFGGMLKSI